MGVTKHTFTEAEARLDFFKDTSTLNSAELKLITGFFLVAGASHQRDYIDCSTLDEIANSLTPIFLVTMAASTATYYLLILVIGMIIIVYNRLHY